MKKEAAGPVIVGHDNMTISVPRSIRAGINPQRADMMSARYAGGRHDAQELLSKHYFF